MVRQDYHKITSTETTSKTNYDETELPQHNLCRDNNKKKKTMVRQNYYNITFAETTTKNYGETELPHHNLYRDNLSTV